MQYQLARVMLPMVVLSSLCAAPVLAQQDRGYLDRPPVFIDSEHDFPLAGMGLGVPRPGQVIPAADLVSLDSDGFRLNGNEVQPNLSVKYTTFYLGALYGVSRNTAAELIIPWRRVRVGGEIGGFPASNSIDGIGGVILGAKRRIWTGSRGEQIVATGLIQLPTGMNHATFDQSNAATNAYFHGYPQRMPLSWQPSTGTLNGLLSLAYGRSLRRFSYAGLVATKLHSSDDEGVKVGDIFVLSGAGTYGVNERLALSLAMTLRVQADDSYPEAPAPGVDQPLLAGTTQHGTTLYLDPSFRFIAFRSVSIGLGVRVPVIKPDNGLVPDTRLDIIFYPAF